MVRIASLCLADLDIGRNPINAFLLSYRLFITPTELLNKLAARYSAKDVRDTDDFSVVQLRVLAFMKVREAVPNLVYFRPAPCGQFVLHVRILHRQPHLL